MNLNELAKELVDIMDDYDHYGFADSLEVGETKEDAANRLAEELKNKTNISGVLKNLKFMLVDAEEELYVRILTAIPHLERL